MEYQEIERFRSYVAGMLDSRFSEVNSEIIARVERSIDTRIWQRHQEMINARKSSAYIVRQLALSNKEKAARVKSARAKLNSIGARAVRSYNNLLGPAGF